MGDFYLDLHRSESSSNVEAFEQFFISEGLFPVISLATHHNKSAKSKSCIDNIFTIESKPLTNLELLLTVALHTHQYSLHQNLTTT